jgi:hypothetical protein
MAKHYAKKGKTKIDPIFDILDEINSQDNQHDDTDPKTIQLPDRPDK